jgi:nucleotide-binding universal stress UspA family protein
MGDEGLVIVGVDATVAARHAAEWATDLASAWGAPLHLVHAVPADAGDRSAAEPSWLSELREAAGRCGVEEVDSRLVVSSIAEELVDRSRDARLVVVGSYGEGSRSGMLAGSVALALVERAAGPVAVVRGSTPHLPPPRRGPVVVGTDAAPGDAALRLGAEPVARALQGLDECLEPVRAAHPALPVDRDVVDDTALRALLAKAPGARMIVVGHRRGPAPHGRLGSTSRGLVAFAPCPVVVT